MASPFLVRECTSWEHFEKRLAQFFTKRMRDRDRFIFRGQADAEWPLRSTLDRFGPQVNAPNSASLEQELIERFMACAGALSPDLPQLSAIEIKLMARHHGLPSSIMDWTRSPYVAAFFAVADDVHERPSPPGNFAIWSLDLAAFDGIKPDELRVVDDVKALRINPRGVEQRSVFLELGGQLWTVETTIGKHLRKFVIPASERWAILERLEYMRIDAASMFRSLDAAATTAAWRVRSIHRGDPNVSG